MGRLMVRSELLQAPCFPAWALFGRSGWSRLVAVLLLSVVAGCAPQVALTGLVTDEAGSPLPGVSVKVTGTEFFAIANGNGLFGYRPGRLTVPPGRWDLYYMKTGFTSATQTIQTGEGRSMEVPPIVLWPLPSARGVFDYENHRYVDWTRVEPERFVREDKSVVFGTLQEPTFRVPEGLHRIVGYRVSPYDWRMSRLEPVKAFREGPDGEVASGAAEEVWAESVRVPVQAVPIDEPEQLLWEIRPSRPVGPGVYAIHWGALEGDPTTDASAYLVEVYDPAVVEAPTAVTEEEATGKAPPKPESGDAEDTGF
jgi:hypothetical protein